MVNIDKKYNVLFFLFFSLTIFLIGSFVKLNISLEGWDWIFVDAADNWSQGMNKVWMHDHPPLYAFFLTILFKIFGKSIAIGRIGNIFCTLVTAFFLFRLASKIYNYDIAFWSVIFYLLNPITIQGTNSINLTDTSFLPLIFVLIIDAVRKDILRPTIKNSLIFSLLICFWAKITSTIALCISILIGSIAQYLFEKREREKGNYKLIIRNILGIAIGFCLFFFTWFLVALSLWGLNAFLSPFNFLSSVVISKYEESKLLSTSYHIIRIFVWISPYFFIIWLFKSWTIFRSSFNQNDNQNNFRLFLIYSTIVYFVGYIVVGGTCYGFPRYHAAVLPLVSIFVGIYVSSLVNKFSKKEMILVYTGVFFLVLLYLFTVQDPILFLNLKLKEMLLYHYSKIKFVKYLFIIFIPLYIFPVLLSAIFKFFKVINKTEVISACLFIGLLSTTLTLDIQQIFASYRTSYQYGAEGRDELIKKVNANIRIGDNVFGTPEFIYELKDKEVPYVRWREWESEEKFINFIKEKRPKAIIGGLTINTYDQLKWTLSEETQLILSKNYSFERIGTYYLWLRIF